MKNAKKIFGGCMWAENPRTFGHSNSPFICRATNEEEAIGLGIQSARDKMPAADGWQNHGANVVEIPQEWLE